MTLLAWSSGIRACCGAMVLAVLGGCAGGPAKPKPQPLAPIAAPMAGKIVWRESVGSVELPLRVAVNEGIFTVASSDGTVLALRADTGEQVWRASVGARLGAGVGSDGTYSAVVTVNGELITLKAGAVAWRKPLGVRVTTPPLVAGERVFVVGGDRSIHAFDALDGRRLWSVPRSGDALTLSQSGVLTSVGNTLLVGVGAKLLGLDPDSGTVSWEATMASPRGANEIERLADLVGPASRIGGVVCARAFQATVGCVDAERGVLTWSRSYGGTDAVAVDAQFVFAADASDRVTAWSVSSGEPVWTHDGLLYRDLGSPWGMGPTVVFGDAEGTLHFLARGSGQPLLRLPTDGGAIRVAPVASGNTMLVVTQKGGLFAFRTE